MSKLPHDITDDEIRVISSDNKMPVNLAHNSSENERTPVPKWNKWLIFGVILLIGALAVFFWWEVKDDTEGANQNKKELEKSESVQSEFEILDTLSMPVATHSTAERGYVSSRDVVVGNVGLTVFTPKNLVPKLHVGVDILKDTTARFVVQAADIRKDNGEIVGAYVYEGNLLSRGQSKSGFCAIINGKLIIGVADSTPYLEQAIEKGGYFFRQYPLVVGGQAVDNQLQSASLRKALAELNGEIVVIMNDKKQTLNEFSKTLVELGVTNAIYLIGTTSPGFLMDEHGQHIEFGELPDTVPVNSNFIVWE